MHSILTYAELRDVCKQPKIVLSKKEIAQINKDTLYQSKRINLFRHHAGKIGASQSKSASHSNPALPS